tara:strand:- start:9928 stop:10791 length:864 start_codon:yes stop_codon:yes gene_type:complete
MIGILGSGFGLYGYLPAICQYYPDKSIFLSYKAKLILNARSELHNYQKNIIWKESYEDIIQSSEVLIISYPPFETKKLIKLITSSSKIKKIIVEKPICETPENALFFLNQMKKANIKIASSFIFIYTEWFDFLKNSDIDIKIHWQIVNKNQKNSWKWNPELGGGLLSFYGIHLISLCAYFNFKVKKIIKNDLNNFEAIFKKKNREILIKINYSNSETFFKINNSFSEETPFGKQKSLETEDFRVSFINDLLNDFEKDNNDLEKLARKTILLWKSIDSADISLIQSNN